MTATLPRCLCDGEAFSTLFEYSSPPDGETRFAFSGGDYRRRVLRCETCGHMMSMHAMEPHALYEQDYVDATYGDGGILRAFERIVGLDPARSDNAGRVRRVVAFAGGPGSVLDVGSGLCVFLHGMKAAGWDCTALDPDPRAVAHARETVGVRAVRGDFMTVEGLGRYDAIAFNKVLEHVKDPVAMLARAAGHLKTGGFVYIELPDGEAAASDGPGREEFFIEHHHIFSERSLGVLLRRAGFEIRAVERLREPSGKYTLRGFVTPREDVP